MTPDGLRAQYLIPNLTPKCECLSIHSSLPLEPRHHAIPRNHRKQFLCRTEAKLPTTSISAESFEEILLRWTGFFTKLGPQIRLPPIPIFGVNKTYAPMIEPGKACSQLMKANNTVETNIKVVGNIFRLIFVFNALNLCLSSPIALNLFLIFEI
jgi:hypothetical protein